MDYHQVGEARPVTLRLTHRNIAALKQLAEADKRSLSAVVELALEAYFASREAS